jgi:uncharacterized NAD(P)/FAD-binding protein YdhS
LKWQLFRQANVRKLQTKVQLQAAYTKFCAIASPAIMPKNKIALIGSGATAIYTMKYLIQSEKPLAITVFESSDEVGKGMPYSAKMNADYMLCNAFSREIPHVTRTLIEWLESLPKRELDDWELSAHELSPRAFYPRLLIGEFLADEFSRLCQNLESAGHSITIKSKEHVSDLNVADNGTITLQTDVEGSPYNFDHVVIASGHSWPTTPRIGKVELLSPWPFTNITALPPGNIGILGSSLSAIDIVVALGTTHGRFDEEDGNVIWRRNENAVSLHITMVSKIGIMPEGDFYYPYPYDPLKIFSQTAVDNEMNKGSNRLLHRLFHLLCAELDSADPTYLPSLGEAARTIQGFSEAYFKQRQQLGGLNAVKQDLAKTRKSMRDRKTIAYRYVLLRAHENFDRALRMFDDDDWEEFTETLLPVFSDSYAAVPHLSLARVIAMYNAGVLSLKAIGNDAEFSNNPTGGVLVEAEEQNLHFDIMVDARGQAAAALAELPFTSLVEMLTNSNDHIKEPFKIQTRRSASASVYCLALPQILERYPFSQGLANAAENGRIVASALLKEI